MADLETFKYLIELHGELRTFDDLDKNEERTILNKEIFDAIQRILKRIE